MYLLCLKKIHFTVRAKVVTPVCLFVFTSKRDFNFPFSPAIEEHAGNGEIPSFEGSTVLFFCPVLHAMCRIKPVVHANSLNKSVCVHIPDEAAL